MRSLIPDSAIWALVTQNQGWEGAISPPPILSMPSQDIRPHPWVVFFISGNLFLPGEQSYDSVLQSQSPLCAHPLMEQDSVSSGAISGCVIPWPWATASDLVHQSQFG